LRWQQAGLRAAFSEMGFPAISVRERLQMEAAACLQTTSDSDNATRIIRNNACQWSEGLRTYYEMMGDAVFVRERGPNLVTRPQWFLDRRKATGRLRAREYARFDNPMA